jgi:adiponectin receptor
VFIALGASGFAPILHAAWSPSLSLRGFAIPYVLAESGLYLLGTGIYVIRWPEKYWSRRFDVWVSTNSSWAATFSLPEIR